MNILFLIHRYPPALGGSERVVQAIAQRLVTEGHQATVYTSDVLDVEGFWQRGRQRLATGIDDDAGVQIHRFRALVLPCHSAASRALGLVPWAPIGMTMAPPGLVLPDLWKAVRQPEKWDLVHASAYPSLMYLGTVAARHSGAKLVLMPCSHPGTDVGGSPGPFTIPRPIASIYRQADAIFAFTERERQLLLHSGVPSDRVHVTGVGVNPDEAEGADGARFRRASGLPAAAPIVTFIGHKTEGKGAFDMLNACEQLAAERPDLVVAMVGAPTKAFTRRYEVLSDSLRSRVLNLTLSEQEKHDLLAASSMLVLPSREDSFGIVLLEAWLHNKPVIGARAGGIPEVIDEDQTGLLVSFGDPVGLKSAINWVLDHPEKAAAMGKHGRARTLQQWTWQAVYERVRAVYQSWQCL